MQFLPLVLAIAALASAAPSWSAPDAASMVAADERMAAGHAHDSPVPTPAATTAAVQAVTEERVAYATIDGQDVYGYLARPSAAAGSLPALIVIHEWWGLNDNVRAEARRLAAEGYVTLAVDLYAGRSADAVPQAMALSQELTRNAAQAEENLRQAYRYLERNVAARRIGAIGWCLGGRWSLRAALALPDKLDAAVIYYGSVEVAETELATLQMPILGLFGARDPVIPLATVTAFERTMKRLGKDVQVHVYEDAAHAFANPSGTTYQEQAAEDSWRRTLDFLRKNLQVAGD